MKASNKKSKNNDKNIFNTLLKILGFIIILIVISFYFILGKFGDNSNKTNFKIYSADKDQCVTIINKGKIRYVINGNHDEIPKKDFIKLDVTKVDNVGDGIWICWKNETDGWEITVNKSKVIEDKLDSSKFLFYTKLERDERGIPTEIKYRQQNCSVFSMYSMRFSPETKYSILEN